MLVVFKTMLYNTPKIYSVVIHHDVTTCPVSKFRWPHVGPTWIHSAPRWANVGPACLAIWVDTLCAPLVFCDRNTSIADGSPHRASVIKTDIFCFSDIRSFPLGSGLHNTDDNWSILHSTCIEQLHTEIMTVRYVCAIFRAKYLILS